MLRSLDFLRDIDLVQTHACEQLSPMPSPLLERLDVEEGQGCLSQLSLGFTVSLPGERGTSGAEDEDYGEERPGVKVPR